MSAQTQRRKQKYAVFGTAFGHCAVAWSDKGLTGVQFPERTVGETVEHLGQRLAGQLEESAPPQSVKRIIAELQSHLQGDLQSLSKVKIDFDGVPPFHRRVYEAARRIPVGATVSYAELAKAAGSPAAARAVGQALARNPYAIVVPCHRILAAGGIGGFSAFGGCGLKQRLLELEGVGTGGDTTASRSKTTSGAPVQPRSGKAPAVAAGQAPVSRRERKHLGDAQAVKKGKNEGAATGMRFSPGLRSPLDFDVAQAVEHVCRVDRKMAKLIKQVGDFRLELDEMLTPFEALAESIVYQQLTGKAAATIFSRVKQLYGGGRLPEPKKIMQTADERLRSAGLSAAKTAALKDLAAKQHQGLIPGLDDLQAMSDEEIIERLTVVRGVGRWTVEMLLIFRLGRPDVLPINDYGVRKGFAVTMGRKDKLPTPAELGEYGQRWRPFRSVAAWYLWRALEL